MLRAISLTSSVAIVTIALSVVTNKVISVFAGTEGMAMMGMFRTLAALVTGVVGLGYATLFNQQAAHARDSEAARKMLQLSVFLFGLQGFASVFLMLTASPLFAGWIFQGHSVEGGNGTIRVVIAMAFVNVVFQNVLGILRGAALLKELAYVQVVVSVASLIAIYPLLDLGHLGLAINVGSGNVLGVALGVLYLNRRYGVPWVGRGWITESWHSFRRMAFPSLLLVWQMAFVMALQLSVQSFIEKFYGLDFLGNYSAAYLVVDTAILVLMSSVRSHFLPELARVEDPSKKQALLEKTVFIHLLLALAGSAVLIVGSKFLVPLLFSRSFEHTSGVLRILSLSTVGFVFTYTYNAFLLHLGKHREFVALDTIWVSVFCLLVFFIGRSGGDPLSVAWAFPISSVMSAMLYVSYVGSRFGRGYLSAKNVLVAVFSFTVLFLLTLLP